MCCGRAKLGYSGITLGSVLWKGYFGLLRDHFGQRAVEELLWATQGSLWPVCCGRPTLAHFGQCAVEEVLWAAQGSLWPVVEELLWLLRDHIGHCAVEELSWATPGSRWPVCCGRAKMGYSGITLAQGPLWPVCCGRATLGYSGITLASVLWKGYFGLLRDHFGQCAVEGLLWATQGSLWPVCCGRATLGYSGITLAMCCGSATLGYSGITLASVLWKSYFGLLRDHFGQCAVEELLCQCAVEELLWAMRDHFGQCAVEELLWASQGSLWGVCCGSATLGYSGITLASVLWKI